MTLTEHELICRRCGGYLGGHPGPHIDTCLLYDHARNQWSTLPSLPDGRAGGGMTFNPSDNSLFFTAGAERPNAPQSADAVDFRNSWKLSLSNLGNGWATRASIPFETNHMSYSKLFSPRNIYTPLSFAYHVMWFQCPRSTGAGTCS